MEKNLPEKSGSFSCREPQDKLSCLPEKSSSFSCRDDKTFLPHRNFSVDADSKEAQQKSEIEEEIEEGDENEKEDFDSSYPKLSEEIDQFLRNISRAVEDTCQETYNPPEIPDSIEKFALLVDGEISKYESGDKSARWCQDSGEMSTLLDAVDQLYKLTNVLGGEAKYASSLNRTSTVLQHAMSFLEEELRSLLEDLCDSGSIQGDLRKQPSINSNSWVDHSTFSSETDVESAGGGAGGDISFPTYSPEIVSKMNKIATAMISAGYETECSQVYSIARRNSFEESLSLLGFEKISIDDVQKMQWESLEGEIATWIKSFKRSVNVSFSGERKLCEAVFSNKLSVSGSLISNLTRGVLIQLLNFAEAVAMTKRSAEKLFKFLDMYETLRDLIPTMDDLFSNKSSSELRSEILSAHARLGEAAVSIFSDLENSIKSDTGKTPVPGGAVHPLTRYVMNYIKYACEYKDTLEQVFKEHQKIDKPESSSESDIESENETPNKNDSPFSIQLMSVMDLLDANLDSKSKLYKDLSLSYIFLMNNGRYIMQKIKGSMEINLLLGDTWCRKRSSDLRQYHKNYQRETWSKVLGCLKDEGLQVKGNVSKPVLKERFKSFNTMFDDIHKTQSSWVVSDKQLQSELRVSISAVVVPAYRSFLGRFRHHLDSGRQSDKYIKFASDDLETYIDELFDGTPASMMRRRS